jgi:hypothetical protein
MVHHTLAQHLRALAPSPPPLVLLVVQRAAAGVAMALPLVGLDAVTGGGTLRSLSTLDEWLTIATTVLVILLAARVAAAVHRWRLGYSDLLELVHSARSVVSIACSFLLPPSLHTAQDLHTQQAQLVADLKRLLLAYVALALHDCRDPRDGELPVEQLRHLLDTAHELAELRRSETTQARVAVVELWIRTRLSGACFSDSLPLIPHAVQTMELHRIVSTLPVLYDSAVRAWSDPPLWRVLTVHTLPVLFGYLVFFTVVRTPTTSAFVLLLWVFSWGLALFGMDAFASAIETHQLSWREDTAAETDPLDRVLLEMQDAIDATAHAFFRSSGGVSYWDRWHRSVQPRAPRPQRPPPSIPRSSSSIAPASPRRSPHSGGSPHSQAGGDGLHKPSLKHLLDMITTSSSPPLSFSMQEGTAAERRPLLLQAPPVPRYDLFLRRDDESSHGESDSDATVVDDEAEHDHGDLSVV